MPVVAHDPRDIVDILDKRNAEAIDALHVWVVIGGAILGFGFVLGIVWIARHQQPVTSVSDAVFIPTVLDAVFGGNRRKRALRPWTH